MTTDRRIRRLERQLRALRALDARHLLKDTVRAVAAIGGLAALWLAVFLKFQWLGGSLPLALLASTGLGGLVWLIGRRSFDVAFLIVYALLILLLEDAPDFSWNRDDAKSKDKKARRRLRLASAVARREGLLARLRDATP